MILPINHVAGGRYTRQRKETQMNKVITGENTPRIDDDYRVGDKVMSKMKSAYKYETPFRCPYEIIRTCKSGTVTLRTGTVTNRINVRNIKP